MTGTVNVLINLGIDFTPDLVDITETNKERQMPQNGKHFESWSLLVFHTCLKGSSIEIFNITKYYIDTNFFAKTIQWNILKDRKFVFLIYYMEWGTRQYLKKTLYQLKHMGGLGNTVKIFAQAWKISRKRRFYKYESIWKKVTLKYKGIQKLHFLDQNSPKKLSLK